jgi:hypothetical protein
MKSRNQAFVDGWVNFQYENYQIWDDGNVCYVFSCLSVFISDLLVIYLYFFGGQMLRHPVEVI